MSLFNQRKNKSFNYKPKFQDQDKESIHEMSSKWDELKQTRKHQSKNGMRLGMWLLIFILVIVLWYVLSNYEM